MSIPVLSAIDDGSLPDPRHLHSVAAGRIGVRVLVVEDHEIVQWGLRALLGRQEWVERCIPARSAEEAMQLTRRYEPHVALIDVFFAGGSGMDVCRQLKELRPSLRILLMSAGGTISIETARSVRAFGVIPKEWSMPQIAQAVEMVANGIPLEVQPQAAGLSAREREVLTLVATGATNNQIAAQLYLSPHTVKDHISSIFRKLGVRNRAEAVQRGHRLGLTAGAETAARAVGS